MSLFFQHSISAYSVFGLVDYFNWLWPKKRFGFHLFQVYHPEFQQPEVLTSIEARAEADKLNEFAQSLKSTISSDRDQIVFNEIIGIVKLLNSQPDKSHLKPRLKSFLKTLDEHRKISILDYMPRAAKSIGF